MKSPFFHNPYHFIPVVDDESLHDLKTKDLPSDRNLYARHDRYAADSFSGRIHCRLRAETPIFVGAQETVAATEENPREVAHFKLDGTRAIPASTIRGVISSLAEAASNSALRVLQRRILSRRVDWKQSLSAVGMIVEGSTGIGLLPLALPTLKVFRDASGGKFACIAKRARPQEPDFELMAAFKNCFTGNPVLKVFIGSHWSIRKPSFRSTFSREGNKDFFGFDLPPLAWREVRSDGKQQWAVAVERGKGLHIKGGRQKFVVSQQPDDCQLRSWDNCRRTLKHPCRGILRVLGCSGSRNIPDNKLHELFLAFPERFDDPSLRKDRAVELLPPVIQTFHDLADDALRRAEPGQVTPYEPKGTRRNVDSDKEEFRLKDGDLVFFEAVADESGRLKITGLSLSSIWRDCVRTVDGNPATINDFFRNQEACKAPLRGDRETITLAEQLFGFVSQREDREDGGPSREFALAGRLRFSHAVLDDSTALSNQPLEQGKVTLKILSSPKPPCPALYFTRKNGPGFIPKTDLKLGRDRPQGRKIYLHARDLKRKEGRLGFELTPGEEPWRTQHDDVAVDKKKARLKQKVRIRPLGIGSSFEFHVDFDNLSKAELQLLCFALRPSNKFIHKIGMGKPLGLGSVSIQPTALLLVDRDDRYSARGLHEARFKEVWTLEAFEGKVSSSILQGANESAPSPQTLAAEFLEKLRSKYPGIAKAFELLGDPDSTQNPVHYPYPAGGNDETENFKWFVKNEQTRRQSLDPITEDSEEITPLELI